MSNNTTHLDISVVLEEVVSRFCGSGIPIWRIVLFGSYAKGTATQNSDIDLMVIIDNDVVVSTYKEKMERYLSLSRLIRELDYAKDLIVYSRKELNIVKEQGYDFIKEIEQTGKIIYERTT